MTDTVEIHPVTTRHDRRAFVRFSWQVYTGDPLWVPPLISERLAYLDPARGGFHAHADVALFMARRGRRILGTIGAFVDRDRVRHTGQKEGGFGFFEVREDYEAAAALLDACRGWLGRHGMASVRGPTSFGDNDCPGVLIAGTDYPPAMMEAHTPPYYRDFLERYGMQKEVDAFAWRATFDKVGAVFDGGPSDIVHVADAARKDRSLSLRTIRLEDWDREVAIIRGLFNATLSQLPGAVPAGEEDFNRSALALKPFLDPELGLIAEIGGAPVGYCLLIPDTNRVLARLNGRLFPFHWMHLKRYIREIDVVSFKLLGVLKEYRRRGIDALLYVEALRKAKERGYAWLDGSLTSEKNPAINLIARGRGAELYKHYRIYHMPVRGNGP
jgi:GNAT superfamily N-acetyltransferase